MAWPQLARIIALMITSFGVITGFQNCSSLDEPTGAASASSQSHDDDIEFVSYPNDVTLYTGTDLHLAVVAQSKRNLALSYQWQKDGVDIPGQMYPAFIITQPVIGDSARYTLKVSNSADKDFIDVNVTIVQYPVLTITTHPQPLTVGGTGGTLTVVAATTPPQALTYQWYKDNVAIAGATAASLSFGATGAARAGNYLVKVSTTSGPPQTATSNTVKVTALETFALGSNGCVNGYCACVTPNQIFVPHQPSALAICVFKGYPNLTTFSTANGIRGTLHCSADGSGCFQNANEGNLTCSSVTCTK